MILRKEKNDFKRKKLKFLKGPKNGQFRNGLVGGFCPKIEISLIAVFFYRNYGHFRKGLVHGFCRKIEISLISVFHRNYVRKDRF